MLRYIRHYDLPEIGFEGQEQISASSALIVGAGGLGVPAAAYLAASGVGHIKIVDQDSVDISNLQRQVLFQETDIKKPKAKVLSKRLSYINSEIEVEHDVTFVNQENAIDLFKGFDIILDCTDSFETRYIINEKCIELGIPFFSGSVHHFSGQVMSLFPTHNKDWPCYKCIYPQLPPDGAIPKCSEAGVFSPLVGIVGALQASQALKFLAGVDGCDQSFCTIQSIEAKTNMFFAVQARKRKNCDACFKA